MTDISQFPFENTDALPTYSQWKLFIETKLTLDYYNTNETFTANINPYDYIALMEAGIALKIINTNDASTIDGSWYGLWTVAIPLCEMQTYIKNNQ